MLNGSRGGAQETALTDQPDDVTFETPAELLGRLKLGREEFCQRLLTSLLLQGPYPRWNTRSSLAPQGLEFLRRLHDRCFSGPWPEGTPVFIDEFELPARHDREKGAAPDYGVLWTDHLWLIELKTEKGSHRRDQVPYYFELGHHHYPNAKVDLTYLTAPMVAPFEPGADWARYAHITWADVKDLIEDLWSAPTSPAQREVIDGLLETIDGLHQTPSEWRQQFADRVSTREARTLAPTDAAIDEGVRLADATADDHAQRALDVMVADLEELLEVRLQIRDHVAASSPGSPLRHVRPWIWRPESTGAPLTTAGEQTGMELRLSWYRNPIE